jgi:hypothetical protein
VNAFDYTYGIASRKVGVEARGWPFSRGIASIMASRI